MHGKSIKTLVDRGTDVIASGGGGMPVYNDKNYKIEGLDAVIDKDFSATKMGRIIGAQELWIISDIDYLYSNFKDLPTVELEEGLIWIKNSLESK